MGKLKVLIIEDDIADFELIYEYLNTNGNNYEITHKTNLTEGISELSEGNVYNVVLLDLGLPESSGRDTLEQILKLEIECSLIIITGLDDTKLAHEAMQRGVQDYILKNHLTSFNLQRVIEYAVERTKSDHRIR